MVDDNAHEESQGEVLLKIETTFLQDDTNYKQELLHDLQDKQSRRWKTIVNALNTPMHVTQISGYPRRFNQRKQDGITANNASHLQCLVES